jgi:Ca2+ transporting ATPase
MANQALRTIVIAYKDCQNDDTNSKDEFGVYNVEKSGLVLLGVLGIKDILRKEVPNAIALCRKAGIKVRMVTGDNKITAKAIARECG